MRVILFLLLFISTLFAEVGKISAVVGNAKILRDSKTIRVTLGTILEKNDIIETQKNAKVQIIFKDNTIVTIGKSSALNINDYVYDPKTPKNSKTDLNFFKGAFKAITGNIGKINKEKFKLRTKSSTIGIRGTTVIGNQKNVGFVSGSGVVTSGGVSVSVGTSEFTQTKEGEPPSTPQPMTSEVLEGFEKDLEPEEEASTTNSDNGETEEGTESTEESSSSENEDENKEESTNGDSTEETSSSEENTSESSTSEETNTSDESSSTSSTSDETTENSASSNDGTESSSSSSENTDETSSTSDLTTNSTSDSTTEASNQDGSISSVGSDDTASTTTSATSEPTVAASTSSTTEALSSSAQTAESTTESSNNTTNTTNATPTEYSMSGYFLGGNNSSVAGEDFRQRSTSFSAKRATTTFSFTDQTIDKKRVTSGGTLDDTDITVSSSFTSSSSFTDPGVGNYSGFPKNNNIGTLSFSYTNPTLSGNYTVYSDNVGEVFVGLYDSANFDEMFVVGTSGNTANLDSSKVYVYREFAFMTMKKDSSGNYQTPSLSNYVGQTEKSYEYYNPQSQSLTHYNSSNIFTEGAKEFIAGYKVTDGTDKNVVAYQSKYSLNAAGTDFDKHTFEKTDASVDMLGTELQALAISTDTNYYENYAGTSSSITQTHEGIGASFLEKDLMFSADTLDTTGYTIQGFNSALIIDEKTGVSPSTTFSLVNDTTLSNTKIIFKKDSTGSYKLEGNINQTTNSLTLSFTSEMANKDGYFIDEDLFGLLQENQGDDYDNGTTYDYMENTGFMISAHDGGVDSSDNPVFTDDDSSWGYWTAAYTDGSNNYIYVDNHSPWVAGIIDSNISNWLTSGTTSSYTFSGQVLGNVKLASGAIEQILVDSNNQVRLNFNLGGGSNSLTSGVMGFKTTSTNWDLALDTTNTTVNNDGSFTSKFTTGNSSNIKGQFYGSGSIKSVGGVFDITDTSYNEAKGVFKATKQ